MASLGGAYRYHLCAESRSYTSLHGLRLVHFFALIPLFDVVLGQIHGLLAPRIGPLSLAQVYHGAMLLVIIAILLGRLRSFPRKYQFVLVSCLCFAGVVILSHICYWLEEGVSLENLVAIGQIMYWLALWSAVFVICRSEHDCRIVLTGIVLAGIYASFSVLYFCITEGGESTGYADVTSSFGGWVTAKGLTGPLVTSALAALWLWREKFRTIGTLAFSLCLFGLIFTYQRAGQVAIVAASLWLLLWYILFARKSGNSTWAIKPAVWVTLAAILIVAVVGTAGFAKRWEDIHDPEKAGSGRVTYWSVASNAFTKLDMAYQLTGVGYTGMRDTMEKRHGRRLHTHSDWFDILLTLGVFGVVGWIILNLAIVRTILFCASHSAEFAIGMAIFLVMLLESFFTGQMFAPHTMTFYLVTITCIGLSAKQYLSLNSSETNFSQ